MTNEVLSYLRTYIAEHGYAPSVRELAVTFGWDSPDTAQRRLQSLVDEGKIERVGPRAIRIVDSDLVCAGCGLPLETKSHGWGPCA